MDGVFFFLLSLLALFFSLSLPPSKITIRDFWSLILSVLGFDGSLSPLLDTFDSSGFSRAGDWKECSEGRDA